MIDDGERHQHGTTPGRHFVNVKRCPRRQQDHFDRNRRKIFPWELAHEGEIKFAESVYPRNATEPQNVGTRFTHEGQVSGVAREFESEIRFYRGVDFARPAEINVPTAVRQLASQDMLGAMLLNVAIDLAQPMQIENVI